MLNWVVQYRVLAYPLDTTTSGAGLAPRVDPVNVNISAMSYVSEVCLLLVRQNTRQSLFGAC